MFFMQAMVLESWFDRLLVFDYRTRQEVIVNTRAARRFRRGDHVRIRYNGRMTHSIPPQITANYIEFANRNNCCIPNPIRALLFAQYGFF